MLWLAIEALAEACTLHLTPSFQVTHFQMCDVVKSTSVADAVHETTVAKNHNL